MKDIKELIYAAVEENAVKFQELINAQLQVRAYDAIEALRPEVGASMFGESSHKKMDDEDEEDMEDEEDENEDENEDEKKSKVEEELKGKQHKIDKNKNGKIDAHDFKLLRKEEVEELDELSKKTTGSYLRKATIDYGRRVRRDALGHAVGGDTDVKNFVKMGDRAQGISRAIKKLTKEEIEALDEIGNTPAGRAALGKLATARNARARHLSGIAQHGSNRGKPDGDRFEKMADRDRAVAKKAANKAGVSHSDSNRGNYDYVTKKVSEEAVNEVAMPQNAADWQALITHQIKTTGHPVATDAQFRATNGKDETKIASLEPGKDKLHYAAAQGGTVKR